MTRQTKLLALRWGLSISIVVIGLLLVEAAGRLFHLVPPFRDQERRYVKDPWLPFRPLPLSTNAGRAASGEYGYVYTHNSQGFRDVERSFVKPPGVFRVLVLGDSFTYGVGARLQEAYPYTLEHLLNRRQGPHPKMEVINAGIPRYWTEPERILLEQYGLKYAPDLVVVTFCPNDVMDTFCGWDAFVVSDSGTLLTREAAALGKAAGFLFKHSGVCRLLLSRYVAWKSSKRPQPRPDEIYRANGFHERDLASHRERTRTHGWTLFDPSCSAVVVHLPIGVTGERLVYPAARLSEWCTRHSVLFVDTLPAMRQAAAAGEQLYYEQDGHCRPAGYRVVAQSVYRQLIEAGCVP